MVTDAVSKLQGDLARFGYLADEGLATAIHLAVRLRRPLLLEGEAGAGKTEVAKTLARWSGAELLRLQCYEGIDVSQAVYEWDYARQLLHLKAAETGGPEALAAESRTWWHAFWQRGYVHLSSADGEADLVERHYHYFLYLMASTSRGKFPPKFNGMLWNTGGDLRTWGAQHWFANLSCYYEALPAANRWDLMQPM